MMTASVLVSYVMRVRRFLPVRGAVFLVGLPSKRIGSFLASLMALDPLAGAGVLVY